MKKMLIRGFAVLSLLLASVCAFGQGSTALFPPVTGPQGQPIPFVHLTFCTLPATFDSLGNCTNTITVFQDIGLTTPYSSAILTDGLGNFPPNQVTATALWFTPASNYCFTETGSNISRPVNFCTPFSVSVAPGSNVSFGTLSATGNGAAGNVAIKNSSTDHGIYVSTTGSDSNDGLSWGSAKLTIQAAFNTATGSGSNPGNVVVACGTYAGPTTWYSNIWFWGWGSSDASGTNFAFTPLTAAPCVKVTYSSTVTLTSVQNTFVRNIFFDFANSGAGFVLNSASSNHFDDNTFNQCGNATTPCVLLKTIDTAGPGHNNALNVFRGTHIIGNNGGGGLNATGFKLLGAGTVNCSGACTGVTLNRFYNTTCAGGVLDCFDFELNSDSNYAYDVNCNQDVPQSGSSCIAFNKLTPASDQDADGELLSGVCATGTFSAQIRAGQTNGSVISLCSGVNGLPAITVLGGTPTFDVSIIGLDGTTKTTAFSGTAGVLANIALGVPSGAVAGDSYQARSATAGATYFGTDGAALFRSGDTVQMTGSTLVWKWPTSSGTLAVGTQNVQKFTSSGTFTIPANVTSTKVTVCAAGGGGGGSTVANNGGGGGSGSCAIKWLTGLTSGNTLAVTIGAAGPGGLTNATGGTGGASSVASGTQTITSILTNGGGGGNGSLASSPGGGGGAASTGGDLNLDGSAGNLGFATNSLGGNGAGSIFGGGAQSSGGAGVNGGSFGAGGGGAGGAANHSGGAGSAGVVIFEWTN